MDYEQFKEEVKDQIKDYLPEEYMDSEVKLHTIVKNNNVEKDALVIFNEDSNLTPTIYLNDLYEQYESGKSMEDILTAIAEMRVESDLKNTFDESVLMDFEQVKDRIVPRLVNAEMNQEMLDERPHKEMDDLAIIYAVVVERSETGIASVPVTNDMMGSYAISTDELHDIAVSNMEAITPSIFQSLHDMVGASLINNVIDEFTSEEEAREMLDMMLPADDCKMFVISNECGINGATAVLDEQIMGKVTEQLGEDFYVLPSSIHECIVMPNDGHIEVSALIGIVQEANATVVNPQERLSDHVYQYDSDRHELVRADIDHVMERENSYGKSNDSSLENPDESGKNAPLEERPKMEEITIKFSEKLVGEPFMGKDGNEYRQVKIPNKDENDKSPWATFVVKSNQVHENNFGSGMWAKLPSEGSTTVRKDHVVGEKDGKKQFETTETKVSNKELKEMLTPDRARDKEQDKSATVTLKMAKGVVGEPFQGKDGNEYRQVKIPNKDENDKSPWSTFVVKSNQIHEDQFGKGMWVKLPAEGTTTVKKDQLVGEADGKPQYETTEKKVPNTELKAMVEFYKDRSVEQEKAIEKASEKTTEIDQKQSKPKTQSKAQDKTEKKEASSLSDRISKKKERAEEKNQKKSEKEQAKTKNKNQER